jgi:hypothetical protein
MPDFKAMMISSDRQFGIKVQTYFDVGERNASFQTSSKLPTELNNASHH